MARGRLKPALNMAMLAVASLALAGCAHDKERFSIFSHTHTPNSNGHHGFASAWADPFAGKGSPIYKGAQIPFGGGNQSVGQPYQVAGRWFYPREQPGYDKTGTASWYGEAFHRRRTSNGEWFDMATLTAAHPTLPLPSYAVVTNLENGRNVIVRVNDRGPFVGSRIMDLSKRAADVLGYRANGKAHVRVRLLGPAPAQDSMDHVVAMNQAMERGATMNQLAALGGNASIRANTQVAQVAPAQPPQRSIAQMASLAAPQAAPQYQEANFIIRVAVFHDVANANNAYQRLASFGPTRIVRAVGVNGPLYRVEIGPLDNKSDADAALTTAQGSGFEGASLVSDDATRVSMR
ncbi:MAG: septal ring lytic transglycosylase RlpA family protein [Pseudomonadota bacterium]|nr:septal ring lytic transglycosylase RlpA family protein [Pseudomonadota bacterium]